MSRLVNKIVILLGITMIVLWCPKKTLAQNLSTIKPVFVPLINDTIGRAQIPFPIPQAPLNIKDSRKKAEYVMNHYWDKAPLDDIKTLDNQDGLEKSIANFLGIATSFSAQEANNALITPLKKSSGRLLRFILSCYYRYLYRYDSPIVNQKLYEDVLVWSTQSPKLMEVERERAKSLLTTLRNNTVGTVAQDFRYATPDKVVHMLSRGFAPLTLLVFYSPNCHVCENDAMIIQNDDIIRNMVSNHQLQVLYIYLGKNEDLWKQKLGDEPSFATVGMAIDDVIGKGLYDIQAWPTIYLLDADHKVILRDCELSDALKYLSNYYNKN